MPEAHAKLSPSAAERWMNCPGSVVLSEGMPGRTSDYAAEGTKAHGFAELMLKDLPCTGMHVEMRNFLNTYVAHVKDLAAPEGSKMHVEVKVHVTEDLWGTADAIVWDPGTRILYVRDLKYGAGVGVEVRGNLQLRIYALAALMEMGYPAHTVDIGVVQPRFNHADGPCRSVEFSAVDLLDFHADLLDAIKRIMKASFYGDIYPKWRESSKAVDVDAANDWEERYLHPTEKGCKWCLAAPNCPAVKALAQATAKQVFAVATPYNPLDLQRTLDSLPILEAWIKNVREFAYEEAERGVIIPGHKLVEKRPTRKLLEGKIEDLVAALGLPSAELYGPAPLLGVTEIQKLAPGKNDKERAEFLAPFTIKESTGHTLVHESDKREAIRVDAKAAFAVIEGSVFD